MTQPKSLAGAGKLIGDAWNFYTSNWNELMKTAGLIIIVGLVDFLASLAIKAYPQEQFAIGLAIVVALLSTALVAWISIRLCLRVLKLEAGKAPPSASEEGRTAWKYFFPMLWVGFLNALAIFVGTILFIIPGIYLDVALCFSVYALLDQDLRGTKALGASYALVKGRWWSVLWRVVAGGFIFGLLMQVALNVLQYLISLISGPLPTQLNTATDLMGISYFFGASLFVQMLVTAIFLPLITGYQVKVYRALQVSR